MAQTVEQRLETIIGRQVIQIAAMQAQIEQLQEQLKQLQEPKP